MTSSVSRRAASAAAVEAEGADALLPPVYDGKRPTCKQGKRLLERDAQIWCTKMISQAPDEFACERVVGGRRDRNVLNAKERSAQPWLNLLNLLIFRVVKYVKGGGSGGKWQRGARTTRTRDRRPVFVNARGEWVGHGRTPAHTRIHEGGCRLA